MRLVLLVVMPVFTVWKVRATWHAWRVGLVAGPTSDAERQQTGW